jgi:hypothetical protein
MDTLGDDVHEKFMSIVCRCGPKCMHAELTMLVSRVDGLASRRAPHHENN